MYSRKEEYWQFLSVIHWRRDEKYVSICVCMEGGHFWRLFSLVGFCPNYNELTIKNGQKLTK